jgi:sulfite reductase (NADPH) flavoprotein alpha-component
MEIALIPPSAPFSPEQRAWLNGFLAGWLGLNHASAPIPATTTSVVPASEPESKPETWHDPSLAIDERLNLAEGEPLPRRLMAAMAQLDCGACGYVCRTYAEAIATGAEPRLTLCSPGGSETSKTLKRLVKEQAPAPAQTAHSNGHAAQVKVNGWSRENPYTAELIRSVNLNGQGSEKETRHVEVALGNDGPRYAVGDSLGVYPENCPELVNEVIAALEARGDEPVTPATGRATTLREALRADCCLSELTEALLEQLAASATEPAEAAEARALIVDDSPVAGWDVLDLLRKFPSARPEPAAFVAVLAAMKPRLYSISSSPKRHTGQVHLTVRRVSYEHNGRGRKGVASTMLADRVGKGAPLRVFVQKSHGFALPDDPGAPIVMIGPGTGIAPFRAFLHERDALGSRGKAWLFFGDQRSASDFLYKDELEEFLRHGTLTRLDTAFSRDQGSKVYVQDRITENGSEVFAWLRDGALIYVCGDAKRMAADVDRALRGVIARHGGTSDDEAQARLKALAVSGRYRRDVY